MVFQSIATPSAELEYVSDHDGGFKQPLERCTLLNRWAFEYFDQTAWVVSSFVFLDTTGAHPSLRLAFILSNAIKRPISGPFQFSTKIGTISDLQLVRFHPVDEFP